MKEATISLIRMQAKNINRKAKQLEILAGIESHYSGFGSSNTPEKLGAEEAQMKLLREALWDLQSMGETIEKVLFDMNGVKKDENPGSL